MGFSSGKGGKPRHRFVGMDRSRVCMPRRDTGSQAGGASRRTLPSRLSTIQSRAESSTRWRCLAEQFMETFVREEPDDEEDEQDEGDDDNEEDDDDGYSE